MRRGSSISGRHQVIKTEVDRLRLIDAVKQEHPRNVAESLGLRPDTVRHYIRIAKDEMRADYLALGLTVEEAEDAIHQKLYRDGCTMVRIER